MPTRVRVVTEAGAEIYEVQESINDILYDNDTSFIKLTSAQETFSGKHTVFYINKRYIISVIDAENYE